MLKKILLALLALVLVLVVVIFLQPNTFKIERQSASINAFEEIYPLISDFHQWERWSPWAKIDPAMKTKDSGAASGQGAIYEWTGSDETVGSGRMEITKAIALKQVDIDLKFLSPMQADNTTTLTIHPQFDSAYVTWSMSGKADFLTKAMVLFGVMDRMVGPDFEKGLRQLKAAAEADSPGQLHAPQG